MPLPPQQTQRLGRGIGAPPHRQCCRYGDAATVGGTTTVGDTAAMGDTTSEGFAAAGAVAAATNYHTTSRC